VHETYFIFYVDDQTVSAAFYAAVLDLRPILDVPGITEFRLREGSILALMPLDSARRLVGDEPFASPGRAPRAEIYLVVDDPEAYHRRALDHGAREVNPMQLRSWGHRAAYSLDLDGHVLAFAEKVGVRS